MNRPPRVDYGTLTGADGVLLGSGVVSATVVSVKLFQITLTFSCLLKKERQGDVSSALVI